MNHTQVGKSKLDYFTKTEKMVIFNSFVNVFCIEFGIINIYIWIVDYKVNKGLWEKWRDQWAVNENVK